MIIHARPISSFNLIRYVAINLGCCRRLLPVCTTLMWKLHLFIYYLPILFTVSICSETWPAYLIFSVAPSLVKGIQFILGYWVQMHLSHSLGIHSASLYLFLFLKCRYYVTLGWKYGHVCSRILKLWFFHCLINLECICR